MNIQHLKYLVEIADCGSVTKASEKLFISQPYLSKVVADAEARLKKQIFYRRQYGLELTPDGHKIYLLAQSVLHQMELLERMEQDPDRVQKESGISVSFGNLMPGESLLLDYVSGSPAVKAEVYFSEKTIAQCLEDIQRNESQFAVIVADDYQKMLLKKVLERKKLVYTELDKGSVYCHMHKDHPLADRQKMIPDLLRNYSVVCLKPDSFSVASAEKYKNEMPLLREAGMITVSHYSDCLSLMKHNGAFMIGNQWQISELQRKGIRSIRLSKVSYKLHLGIVKKEGIQLSWEAERFLNLFSQKYVINEI